MLARLKLKLVKRNLVMGASVRVRLRNMYL